ncbi:MAG: cytochrome C oxidase subunit IV family protein [Candidatus Rokubacteria bacterium]|nr:cytochrome C oxidase subunit IV family protein [Candidatus Rokubacteria bacterium]
MTTHAPRSNYVAIWVWLVLLMAAGVAASFLPGARALAVTAIFATAAAKALLVALHYMHLKLEPWVIYAIALIPVALVAILALTLLPDFSFHH